MDRDKEGAVKLHGDATRLTVYVGESDRHHHKPVYDEIVHRAHAAGLAGASVFRGLEGYGASHHIRTTRILSLSDDLPIAIVIIDTDEKIRGFLPQLDDVIGGGALVTLDPVEVVHYVGRHDNAS
jgi:uncharacterized protein